MSDFNADIERAKSLGLGKYRLEFELMGLPSSQNARLNWRERHDENKRWESDVGWMTKGKLPAAPLTKAKLTCVRCSSTPADSDNVAAGFKPIIDALVKFKILKDDKFENIGLPEYRWEKATRKLGRVRVIVEESI